MSDYESIAQPDDDNSEKINKNNDTENNSNNKLIVPFWSENPNILLNTTYMFEFFPTSCMTYEQKLNAISRLVIVLSVIGFMLSKSIRIVIISTITLFSIYLLYKHHIKLTHKINKDLAESYEGFSNPALDVLKMKNISTSPDAFMNPSAENPFSNVLLNDYEYNTDKKPAPYVGNPEVSDKILDEAKDMVQKLNPGQPDIANKLFRDLGEQFVFEQSMRPFYSTANTTVVNDQSGFADFCYGSMISCKEGNLFACVKDNAFRYINQ